MAQRGREVNGRAVKPIFIDPMARWRATGEGMRQAIDHVREELAARCARIDGRAAHAAPGDIAHEIDQIRAIAHRNGMNPVVTVAHFVGSALSRGERGAPVRGWLSILAEAIGSERQDIAACDAFAAACSVRLAG